MKKKVFFVLSSLRAGGSERVFWLLSQYFDRRRFDVTLVLLDMKQPFFSTNLDGIRIIDLNSIRSSRSFWKLFRLLKKEKPDVIYSTAPQVNLLVSFVSFFGSSRILIARESCIPDQLVPYISFRGRILEMLISRLYRRFDFIICQSEEMRQSLAVKYRLNENRLIVIPNPVVPTPIIRNGNGHSPKKKIIAVGRMVKEKGHERILQVFAGLPAEYELTIAGGGPLKEYLIQLAAKLGITKRVHFAGQVHEITKLIAEHDLMVLGSFTEGFPNVVIEALSVGIPVVTFSVGGVSQVIEEDFNGYIVPQGDLAGFRHAIIKACEKKWDAQGIKAQTIKQFGIQEVTSRYASLI